MTLAGDSWRRIRRLRASPPLLAGVEVDQVRTRVFQAALTQAEELWEAASVVGAASRPLPLFYCLSQAGRAVCAAWTTDGPWEATGHGLSSQRQDDDVDVPSFEVKSNVHARGMFGLVAAATDSAVFDGSVSIGALWASLTDLSPAVGVTGTHLRPIEIEATNLRGEDVNIITMLSPKRARIHISRPVDVNVREQHAERDEDQVERIKGVLRDYPSAADAVVEMAEVVGKFGYERVATVQFPDGEGGFRDLSQVAERLPSPVDQAQFIGRTYVLRPRLGTGDGTPPSQLMTMWALLFGLSQLARYHPALWVEALNPDRSEIAVDLEHVLESALVLVPDLLVPAVSNGAMPRLIREHMAAERQRERAQDAVDVGGGAADTGDL